MTAAWKAGRNDDYCYAVAANLLAGCSVTACGLYNKAIVDDKILHGDVARPATQQFVQWNLKVCGGGRAVQCSAG